MKILDGMSKTGLLIAAALILGGIYVALHPWSGPLLRIYGSPHSSSFVEHSPQWAYRVYGVASVLLGAAIGAFSAYRPRG